MPGECPGKSLAQISNSQRRESKAIMKPSLNPIGELLTDAALGLSCRIRQPVPLNPAKCVVLLHGVGGNETNLIEFAAGIDPDTLVVFPRGPLHLGAACKAQGIYRTRRA